jgi:hypothetical protein
VQRWTREINAATLVMPPPSEADMRKVYDGMYKEKISANRFEALLGLAAGQEETEDTEAAVRALGTCSIMQVCQPQLNLLEGCCYSKHSPA